MPPESNAESSANRAFELVIFDLDGTLIDSRPDIAASLNAVLAAHGFATHEESEIEAMIGEGAWQLVERGLGSAAKADVIEPVLAAFLAHYRAHPVDKTLVYPGVREGLAQLAGVPCAVATNKPGDLARTIVERLGLAKCFALVVGEGDVARRKPDPAMLESAITKLGARRDCTLYVGDGPVDLLTARNAGVPLCLVEWGYRSGKEIAGADFVAGTFDEVLEVVRGVRKRAPGE